MKLEADYKDKILSFEKSFLKLNVNVTPKIHAILFHIAEFIDYSGCGLGLFSEQSFEGVHYDFRKHWEVMKINDLNHPNFGKKLKTSIKIYNSRHL